MKRMLSPMLWLSQVATLLIATLLATACGQSASVVSAPPPPPTCLVIPRSLLVKPTLPSMSPSPAPITITRLPQPCKPPSTGNTSKP